MLCISSKCKLGAIYIDRLCVCSPLTSHGPALAPLVADDDGLLVLPLPGDGRLGVASKYELFREALNKSMKSFTFRAGRIGSKCGKHPIRTNATHYICSKASFAIINFD